MKSAYEKLNRAEMINMNAAAVCIKPEPKVFDPADMPVVDAHSLAMMMGADAKRKRRAEKRMRQADKLGG